MFSPLELEKIEFERAFMGGYKKRSVDEVFALVVSDYTTLYSENIAYKDKVAMLDELVKKYKAMEDTMQNALVLAQTASDQAVTAAREKAEALLREAQDKIDHLDREAKEERKKIEEQYEAIKREISTFTAKNISLLMSQIELLKSMAAGTNENNEENNFKE